MGGLYPILIRLADRGLLETSWEEGTPAGRPRPPWSKWRWQWSTASSSLWTSLGSPHTGPRT